MELEKQSDGTYRGVQPTPIKVDVSRCKPSLFQKQAERITDAMRKERSAHTAEAFYVICTANGIDAANVLKYEMGVMLAVEWASGRLTDVELGRSMRKMAILNPAIKL